MQTKTKCIRITQKILDEVKEKQSELGFTTETQTIVYLIRLGIDSMKPPAYVANKQPRKTEVEKLLEKKEAEEVAHLLERKEFEKMMNAMGGSIVTKEGVEDKEGTYGKYNVYTLMNSPSGPKRIATVTEINPLWYIKENEFYKEEYQYQGANKTEVDDLLASGNYVAWK